MSVLDSVERRGAGILKTGASAVPPTMTEGDYAMGFRDRKRDDAPVTETVTHDVEPAAVTTEPIETVEFEVADAPVVTRIGVPREPKPNPFEPIVLKAIELFRAGVTDKALRTAEFASEGDIKRALNKLRAAGNKHGHTVRVHQDGLRLYVSAREKIVRPRKTVAETVDAAA